MIRAVVQKGVIRPFEPLPDEWADGYEVTVDGIDADADHDAADNLRWYTELRNAGKASFDPDDWIRLQATLKEMKEQSKEQTRIEMGL